MQVQRRRHRPSVFRGRVRARTLLLGVAIPLLAVGCAHAGAKTEEPAVVPEDPELAQLRRENAGLRAQLKNLEERVRQVEDDDGSGANGYASADGYARYGSVDAGPEPSWSEPEGDGPRQLPVIKLTPEGRSIDRGSGSGAQAAAAAQPASKPKSKPAPEPVGRRRGSISLSPIPNSGAPYETGREYVVDARDDFDDDPGLDDADSDAVDPAAEPASYRLVGSKLVQATKRKPSPSPSKSSDRDTGVVKDYKDAMSLYKDGRYADAERAFASIVSGHPRHDYADNALYWQGEAAYDQAHYADALAAFTKVVEHYGGGNKAPDALLKIGLCYGRLGDAANARDVLTQLIAAYPAANASKIAKRKLSDLAD